MFCEDILNEGECIWTECIGVLSEDLDVGMRGEVDADEGRNYLDDCSLTSICHEESFPHLVTMHSTLEHDIRPGTGLGLFEIGG